MGKSGRFGKYGETKRFDRLRKAGTRPFRLGRSSQQRGKYSSHPKKVFPYNEHIKIVPANMHDAGFIRSLSERVFRKYGPYDETLTRWFLSGAVVSVLASVEERHVGFAMLGRSAYEHLLPRVYELLAIAVEPGFHGLGIGSLLLKEIEIKAKELNAELLVLHTAVSNSAGLKLFKKNGFIVSKTKGGFYPEGQDALMMHKRIT